ncbi:MAG: thiamine pyrophosphate-dependent enzyme [Bacteroidales bacterium]
MKLNKLLLGDEAIATGAVNSGILGVYAYPGTPSTEITEYIQSLPITKERGIHNSWCTNEKTAMEAALGVSYVGKRSIVCMKHVGLNVAADAFVNSAMSGVNGGLIVVSADDPSMHSSQNEQDSRFYAKFAFVPVLEPSNQQEAYDMMEYGFNLSEQNDVPVLLRVTTRMAHSRAIVEIESEAKPIGEIKFPKNPSSWILLPANSRKRYPVLLETYSKLEKISATSQWNKYIEGKDKKMGIIACGIAYNYLRENIDKTFTAPIIKISQYPIPTDLINKMAQECDSILVMEEGQPLVEEMIKGILPTKCKIFGRLSGHLPRVGELTPDSVRIALGLKPHAEFAASSVAVPRPPALCQGCGHRDVYNALNETLAAYPNHKVFSDIGCYTLGALPPFRAINSTIDMGASITMAKGAADAGLYPSVAVIGDSTFTHSGMTGLLDAANANANMVVVISDNLTTGMTGGQNSAGTTKLEAICKAVGVDEKHIRIVVPLAKNMEEIKAIIKEEIEYKGLSVIIPRRECIQTFKRHSKEKKNA